MKKRTFKTFLLMAIADPEQNKWTVEAYTSFDARSPRAERVVGLAVFAGIYDDDLELIGLRGWDVGVNPAFRRQGLASAMYEFAEESFKVPVHPGGFQTPMGEQFLQGRKRMLNPQHIAEYLEKTYGVSLWMSLHGDVLTVSRLIVPKEKREAGIGTSVMEAVHDYADQMGFTVALSPSSDFGGSKVRLENFYRRMGYVPNKGRNKDFSISETMIRRPVTQVRRGR